jgi:integrase/recombinase XerD
VTTGDPVASIKLKYLLRDRDRHGNFRFYVRMKGKRKIRIREPFGTEEFISTYHKALSEIAYDEPRTKAGMPGAGSFGRVCLDYYASPAFKNLDDSTKNWLRSHLDAISIEHGNKLIEQMAPKHVEKLMQQKAAKPAAANKRLKALKALFRWAVRAKLVSHNPTVGVEKVVYQTRGHPAWSMEEIATYRAKHPVGTQARLAMELMFYTACRREDAVRLGPQHIKSGRVRFTQAKNEARNPSVVDILQDREFAKVINATKSGPFTFLINKYNRPFTVAGFGNRFKAWCREAGLPHLSAHGLRKARATQLAEAGCSAHEIMAITGHRSLSEVQRYTQAVQRKKLADEALAKLGT